MATIFQMTYLNEFSWMKMFKLWPNFIAVCSQKSNWQYVRISSDNGLASTRQQAIIWTSVGQFTDTYVRHSALMS